MRPTVLALCLSAAAGQAAAPAAAQTFTTAAEVRPILEAQKGSWVAVRLFDGRDLVYFTAILAWRCGLESLRYGLNGAPPETPFEMEPCNTGTASPNAMTDDRFLPYIVQPAGSVASVSVEVTYDDGTVSTVDLDRSSVLMP